MENDKEKQNSVGSTNGGWDVSVTTSVGEKAAAPDPAEPAAREVRPAGGPPSRPVYPVWVLVLAIVGVFFASRLVGGLIVWAVRGNADTSPGAVNVLFQAAVLGVTIAFSWWLCRRHGNLPPRPLSFSLKKTNPTLILWGLVLVLITSMVIEPLLDIFPREYLDRLNSNIGSGGWAMLGAIVVAPVLEEILFRGIIQQQLTGSFGRIRGVVMAAAIFGIAHYYPQQAVNAFFIGIILGYLYVRSASLVPAIIIHAINNAIAYIIIQFTGGNLALTKDLFGNRTFYWIVYGVCCLIFVIAAWNLLRELKKLDTAQAEQQAARAA